MRVLRHLVKRIKRKGSGAGDPQKELSFKRMHRNGEGRVPYGQSPSPHIKQNGRPDLRHIFHR